MSITFHIPGPLRQFTGGLSRVAVGDLEVSPIRLADALNALWALYPGVRDRIVTEQGQVREHINLFVGSESVRDSEGLATPVPEGTEVSIVPAISGG